MWRAAYVFGSVAGGTARPESDVDIAVLFTTPPPHTLDCARFTLAGELEAALDVASHIVSDRRLGEPRTNRELFDLLERDGWLDAPLAATLRNMAGFRNVLVHGRRCRPGGGA